MIRTTAEQVERIRQLGKKAYPDECCGFLLGQLDGTAKHVLTTVPVANEREATEKYHRFFIGPDTYQRCERQARERGMEVLGFYHSHPDAPARPSQYDIKHAWPWYSYIIVSVMKGKSDRLTSWVLQDDRDKLNEEKINLVDSQGTYIWRTPCQ